jgi:hypothetical protein
MVAAATDHPRAEPFVATRALTSGRSFRLVRPGRLASNASSSARHAFRYCPSGRTAHWAGADLSRRKTTSPDPDSPAARKASLAIRRTRLRSTARGSNFLPIASSNWPLAPTRPTTGDCESTVWEGARRQLSVKCRLPAAAGRFLGGAAAFSGLPAAMTRSLGMGGWFGP